MDTVSSPSPAAAAAAVEPLCVAVGPVERAAERRLLSVLWGAAPEPLTSPAEGSMLIQVAMHGTRSVASSSTSALSSVPKAERLVAALAHPDLSSADVDAARGADSLTLARSVAQHPACTPATVVKLAQTAASYASSGSSANAVLHFLASAAGPYGRAASLVGTRCPHLSQELFMVLAFEAGALSEAELEVFSTLLSDFPSPQGQRVSDVDLFASISGLIDQARLVIE